MLRQDYAPEPVVPKYPPLRGFGYRLPIIPKSELAADRSSTFDFTQIEQGAKQFSDELRQKVLQQVLAGNAVQFDPLSGIQPETEAERLSGRAQPTLRQGPLHQLVRERLGPLGRSNLGEVGIGDFVPGIDVALTVDDLASVRAREQAGLDVGVGEKVGAVMGVPLAVIGLGRLSKAGGELFDRVARRLGRKPEPSIFEKLAKEGASQPRRISRKERLRSTRRSRSGPPFPWPCIARMSAKSRWIMEILATQIQDIDKAGLGFHILLLGETHRAKTENISRAKLCRKSWRKGICTVLELQLSEIAVPKSFIRAIWLC
jgi:hypothetical protein